MFWNNEDIRIFLMTSGDDYAMTEDSQGNVFGSVRRSQRDNLLKEAYFIISSNIEAVEGSRHRKMVE